MPDALYNEDCQDHAQGALINLGRLERERYSMDGDVSLDVAGAWQVDFNRMLQTCLSDSGSPLVTWNDVKVSLQTDEMKPALDFMLALTQAMTAKGPREWTIYELRERINMSDEAMNSISALTAGVARRIMQRSVGGGGYQRPPDLGRWAGRPSLARR